MNFKMFPMKMKSTSLFSLYLTVSKKNFFFFSVKKVKQLFSWYKLARKFFSVRVSTNLFQNSYRVHKPLTGTLSGPLLKALPSRLKGWWAWLSGLLTKLHSQAGALAEGAGRFTTSSSTEVQRQLAHRTENFDISSARVVFIPGRSEGSTTSKLA